MNRLTKLKARAATILKPLEFLSKINDLEVFRSVLTKALSATASTASRRALVRTLRRIPHFE